MTLYQITVNGKPHMDPVDVGHRNALLYFLNGVVDNVDYEEVMEYPRLVVLEGGRK